MKDTKGKNAAPAKGATKTAPVKPAKLTKAAIEEESSEESEDATPKNNKSKGKTLDSKKTPVIDDSISESSEENAKPKKAAANGKAQPAAKGKAAAKKQESDDSEESEEEVKTQPKKNVGKAQPVAAKGKPTKKDSSDEDEESEEEQTVKKPVKGAQQTTKAAPAKNAKKDMEEEEEDEEEEQPAKKPEAKSFGKNQEKQTAFNPNQDSASCTVWVGNLSWNTTEDSLAAHFASCGEVISARINKDPETGRSKGFAHVDFADPSACQKAVEMAGSWLDNREIRVDFSGASKKSGGFGGNDRGNFRNNNAGGGFGGDKPKSAQDPNSTTVWVGNLSWNSNEDSIKKHFSKCGKVTGVRIATDPETGRVNTSR